VSADGRLDPVLGTLDRMVARFANGATRVLCAALDVETSLRLPLRFDARRLQSDLRKVDPALWTEHRAGYHDGSWSAVSLVGNSGDPRDIHITEGRPFVDTELIAHTPYFREVVTSFRGAKRRARLMKIAAGGRIFLHHDSGLSVDHGVARLHVPVQSDPGNHFWLAGRQVDFRTGETWFGEFSFPHEAHNRSTVDRVHLVFDVQLDAALLAMLPAGFLEARRRRNIARRISCRGADAVSSARATVKRALNPLGVGKP
jgi:hypothetical protein